MKKWFFGVVILFLLPFTGKSATYKVGLCEYSGEVNSWKSEYFTIDADGDPSSCNETEAQLEDFTNWQLEHKVSTDYIEFSWGSGGPYLLDTTDCFGIIFKAIFYASKTGSYTFCAYPNDGVQIAMDGTVYSLTDGSGNDCWSRRVGATQCSVTLSLSQGYHYLEVRYYEGTGDADIWFGLDNGDGVCDDADYPFPTHLIHFSGVRGEYYEDASPGDFTTSKGISFDNRVDFDWGTGAPSRPSGVPVDYFSVRWSGNLIIPTAGTYTLCVRYNDAARLILDGSSVLLDDWNVDDTVKEWVNSNVYLTEGFHLFILEYFEGQGSALAQFGMGTTCDGDPTTPITAVGESQFAVSEKACSPASGGILSGGGCEFVSGRGNGLVVLVLPLIFAFILRRKFIH